VIWNLTYNADKRSTPEHSGVRNRAQSIGDGTYGATYLYDGDGVRVGQLVNGVALFISWAEPLRLLEQYQARPSAKLDLKTISPLPGKLLPWMMAPVCSIS